MTMCLQQIDQWCLSNRFGIRIPVQFARVVRVCWCCSYGTQFMYWAPEFLTELEQIFSIPLNTVIARILKKMQTEQMKAKDRRTKLMSELLNNIRSIKLYAWDYAFMSRVFRVRNDEELKNLRKISLWTVGGPSKTLHERC